MKKIYYILIVIILTILSDFTYSQNHPCLLLTKQDVADIKSSIGKYPLFDKIFNDAKNTVEKAMATPIDVPVPKDAGGYTHERHKKNYTEMQLAGLLYSVTGDKKYAEFIKQMLMKYSELYPKLGKHPAASSESSGRLFWQSLNETVWLVYTSQAYDFIYNWLKPSEREMFEKNIFKPMAKFLSEEKIDEFDRIHNHGTWTVTAVGMIGYVMGDKDLTEKALYGSKKNGSGGFLKQLEMLYSPDGFYTEGAYYARYAIFPFITFAKAISNNQPELKIFNFRDQIIKKAIYSIIQLTNTNGAFFPINDALKEKSYLSPEIISAIDFAYSQYGEDNSLLFIADKQKSVDFSGDGLKVARALVKTKQLPEPPYKSIEFSDGPNGDEGGFGILRSGNVEDQSILAMKYTGHGLSHGHYDKLSMLYYDNGNEILQDYGASRFINVETKMGGRYLPETKTFTRQTISHNTVTVDEKSHYGAKEEISEKYHADKHFFNASNPDFQIMSSKVDNAYNGIKMQRTMIMLKDKTFSKPLIVDLFKVNSSEKHQYDLPFWYMGHLTYSSLKYKANDKQMSSLGKSYGYQHIWNEAETLGSGVFSFSWLQGNRYYSITTNADSSTKIIFGRIGAGDPDFNLRHEPGVILRYNGTSHVFASVIEPHGSWDGIKEFSQNARGIIQSVKVLASNDNGTVVEVTGNNSLRWLIMINNEDASENKLHVITAGGKEYKWTGNYSINKD